MVVGWTCGKQVNVASYTTEDDFVAASQAVGNLIGPIQLLGEFKVRLSKPMLILVDNQAAFMNIQVKHSARWAKRISLRLIFIKNYSTKKVIKVVYRESHFMRYELLTKNFGMPRLEELSKLIEML